MLYNVSVNTPIACSLVCFPGMSSSLAKVNKASGAHSLALFLKFPNFLMFLNIQIDLLILKTYHGQFTLTTKKSLHIIFKLKRMTVKLYRIAARVRRKINDAGVQPLPLLIPPSSCQCLGKVSPTTTIARCFRATKCSLTETVKSHIPLQ